MKRKTKTKEININRSTKLYFDDIEQIYALFMETMDSVSIETEDYEFESLQEFLEYNLIFAQPWQVSIS